MWKFSYIVLYKIAPDYFSIANKCTYSQAGQIVHLEIFSRYIPSVVSEQTVANGSNKNGGRTAGMATSRTSAFPQGSPMHYDTGVGLCFPHRFLWQIPDTNLRMQSIADNGDSRMVSRCSRRYCLQDKFLHRSRNRRTFRW